MRAVADLRINKLKERVDDKKAAKNTPGHNDDEHSNRSGKYYASIEEIISNPVPFDCIQKEVEIKESEYNPNLNGFNHRYKAIGHDPFLGLIFGTANIMTNTITVTEGKFVLSSYHVHTGESLRTFNGIQKTIQLDKICERANTIEIFSRITNRISKEGAEGWKALGAALLKELVHLVSDIRTEKSLPLPFLSLINPDISRSLNLYGVDFYEFHMVGAEMKFAQIINFIISKIHEWCYNEEKDGDKEMYMVRNMKIVQISNELATGVNCLKTAVQMYIGDLSVLKNIDLGGALVTLYNTWNTPLKIAQIKQEYTINKTIKYIKQ